MITAFSWYLCLGGFFGCAALYEIKTSKKPKFKQAKEIMSQGDAFTPFMFVLISMLIGFPICVVYLTRIVFKGDGK